MSERAAPIAQAAKPAAATRSAPTPSLAPASARAFVATLAPAMPMRVQRKCAACNAGGPCDACQDKVQARLRVGATHDPLEAEADAAAAQVMRAQHADVARRAVGTLQRRSLDHAGVAVASPLAARIDSQRGGGEPLSPSLRAWFEPRFGRDFGAVRVHADDRAASLAGALSAHAFTVGRDIFFAAHQYRPAASAGRELIAHELAHVVQQSGEGAALLQRRADPGCGPSNHYPGNLAHELIEADYLARVNPAAIAEYRVPGGSKQIPGEPGYIDVVDLPSYALYEIKPLLGAIAGDLEAAHYLDVARRNCDAAAPWHLGATYPPPPEGIPVDQTTELMTSQTDQNGRFHPGVILYWARRRKKKEQEQKQQRAAKGIEQAEQQPVKTRVPRIVQIAPELRDMQSRFQVILGEKFPDAPLHTNVILVAPELFFQKFVVEPFTNRQIEGMRIKFSPRTSIVWGYGNVLLTLAGIYAGAYAFAIFAGVGAAIVDVAAAGAVGAGAGTAGAAGGGGAGATIIPIARAAAAAPAVKELAAAAGVLMVVGLAGRGEAAEVDVSNLSAVRAVPAVELEPAGATQIGAKVRWAGSSYFVIGRAES